MNVRKLIQCVCVLVLVAGYLVLTTTRGSTPDYDLASWKTWYFEDPTASGTAIMATHGWNIRAYCTDIDTTAAGTMLTQNPADSLWTQIVARDCKYNIWAYHATSGYTVQLVYNWHIRGPSIAPDAFEPDSTYEIKSASIDTVHPYSLLYTTIDAASMPTASISTAYIAGFLHDYAGAASGSLIGIATAATSFYAIPIGTEGQVLKVISGLWAAGAPAAGGGGGAPVDADYLIGTANATLSSAIVVGPTPGGDLGNTWAAPSVDDDSHNHTDATVTLSTYQLASLSTAKVWIGNTDGTASATTISTDVTIDVNGVATVVNDSHTHTGSTLSGVDISDDTNLTAGDALTLTDDDLDFDGGATPGGILGGTWASPTIDLALGKIFTGNGSNVASASTVSGDGTIDTNGTLTVTNDSHAHTNSTITLASTDLTDTADLLYETELDDFSELQAQIADKTLVNEEDVFTIDANWVNTANPWADNEVADALTLSTVSGAVDMGAATSLEIPNAAAPTTNAIGEIAVDSNSGGLEVYSASESSSIIMPFRYTKDATIFAPDGVNDEIRLFRVDAEAYPHGITIEQVSIELPADAAYTMVFAEFSGDPPTSQSTIATVTTGAADAYAENTSPSDPTIAADAGVWIEIPATDVDWIAVQVIFTVIEGN